MQGEGTMGNHIAGISWKYSYAKSVTSFAGTMKSFAGMAFWTNIKRKIEASYQPVIFPSISRIALAGAKAIFDNWYRNLSSNKLKSIWEL